MIGNDRAVQLFRSSVWLVLVGLQVACTEKTSSPVVALEAGRDFGYTVGSLVDHRIVVDLPPNTSVDPKLLPSPGPVNDWLDLRTLHWSMPRDDRLQIDLTYLILRGVKSPEPTAIPALTLSVRHGDAISELHAPDWPFTLMPVIPPGIPDEKLEIRGMRSRPAASGSGEQWALAGSLFAAAACAFLVAWRRGLFPALGSPAPFTAALRELGHPSFALNPAERYTAALKRIHRAIDQTAGSAVFPASLAAFLDRHPAFTPLRAEFEQFFRASQRHFFATTDGDRGGDAEWQALVDFCRRCARAERGPR